MKYILFSFATFFLVILIANCTKIDLENPYDPEAGNYIYENIERIMINDFNSDYDSTLIGSYDGVQGYYGGEISKELNFDRELDSRVLMLKINLPVVKDSARVHWNQSLGNGRFNVQTLGLHYLSFMAKSKENSMKIEIAFFDTASGYTFYDFEINSKWKRYQIPFESLGLIQSNIDLKNIKYIAFNFFTYSNPGESILYLDDLAFE